MITDVTRFFSKVVLLLGLLGGISLAAPRIERAQPAAPESTSPATVGDGGNVILRVNDLFELRMSGMPPEDALQFSGSPYTVGSDGTVSIPLIGRTPAAGKTPSQLERGIEKELTDRKIFRWPNATVNVVNSARYITVGGMVRAPQRMPWSADLTLLAALSAAGGGSDFAGDKVNLTRNGRVNQYRVSRLKKDPSKDPRLTPGDQVEQL